MLSLTIQFFSCNYWRFNN